MGDLVRTERLLNILYTIQKNQGIQAKQLAKIFGKNIRTIQRDVANLRKLGFQITSSTGAAGGFASRGSYNLKPLTFSGEEAHALFVASSVLLKQSGFPYQEDLKNALAKIADVINEKDEKLFNDLHTKTSLQIKQLKDYFPLNQIFTDVNQAILQQKVISLLYDSYSSQTVSRRMVDPYHMLFQEGWWYLIGHCHNRMETRIFRIDRIREIEITDKYFELPADFSLEQYFNKSWRLGKGEKTLVKVHFSSPVARLIREGQWHSTQVIEDLPGDNIIFTVTVEGTWEIKKWILGWGSAAVCLEPESLRLEIASELEKMVWEYGKER